jgi:hypothetical protein
VTGAVAGARYVRSDRVAWRDTGVHVLALPTRSGPRTVLQLSGLGAEIWRLLDRPRTLEELREHLPEPDATPSMDAAVADLVAAGLLFDDEDG